MKKIFKLIKKILIIFLVVFIVIGFISKCNDKNETISASAEEIEELQEIKSSNLIDFSKYIAKSSISVSVNNPLDNGTLTFKGISETNWQHLVKIPIDQMFEDKTVLCLSQSVLFKTATNAVYLIVNAYDKKENNVKQIDYLLNKDFISFSIDKTIYKDYTIVIAFGVPVGVSVDYTISFMCNEGSSPLPYQPNLQGFYETAYSDGSTVGYKNGVLKGQEKAQNGIFAGATISGNIGDRINSPTVLVPFGPYSNFNYVSGGIDFQQFTKSLEEVAKNKWGDDFSDYWNGTLIDINLKDSVALSSLELFGQGNSTSFFGAYDVTDTNGNIYSLEWKDNNGSFATEIKESFQNTNILINKISFRWGGGADGLDVTIYQKGIGYDSGFANGFNEGNFSGYIEGNQAGYNSGYKQGTIDGEATGYNKAVSEGVSGTGILYSVFALIKTFFSLITTLLETKIAGDLTIGLFVIGIPATFMIINLVIKLVKNLASGGGGNDV